MNFIVSMIIKHLDYDVETKVEIPVFNSSCLLTRLNRVAEAVQGYHCDSEMKTHNQDTGWTSWVSKDHLILARIEKVDKQEEVTT